MAIEGLKFDEKPWWQAVVIGLVIAGLVVLISNYALFSGMRDAIKAKEAQLKSLNEQIEKGRAAERKLAQFREEVKRLELELQKLLQVLPPERDTEDLIKKVEALVHQGDFNLKSFKTAEPVPKDFYKEYPIDISLDGTYHNLALFFARMSNFPRIVNVDNLKVSHTDSVTGKTLTATFVAKTFIYTGDEDTAAKPAAGRPAGASNVQKGAAAVKSAGAGPAE